MLSMHHPKEPTQVQIHCVGAAPACTGAVIGGQSHESVDTASSEMQQLRVGREVMSYHALAVNGDVLGGHAVSNDQHPEAAAEVERGSSALSALPWVAVADPEANSSTITGQQDQVVSHQESLQSDGLGRCGHNSNWRHGNRCDQRGEGWFKGVRAIALVLCLVLLVVVLLQSPMLSLRGLDAAGVGTEHLQDDRVLEDAQLLGTVWPLVDSSASLLGSTGGKTKSPSGNTSTVAERHCHTAVRGEACYECVSVAMKDGIRSHPDQYGGLNASSSFEEFQAAIHRRSPRDCPLPCGASKRASSPRHGNSGVDSDADTGGINSKDGPCHTTRKGEACYEGVRWAMHTGIQKHPKWYHGLDKSSGIVAFQDLLHRSGYKHCPRPCAQQEDLKHVQARNHGHSGHKPSATDNGGAGHEESLSWDDLGGRHEREGTAADASDGPVPSTEAVRATTTGLASSSETKTSTSTFSTSTTATTAMEADYPLTPNVSAGAGSTTTSSNAALTTAPSDTVPPPAEEPPAPVVSPVPVPAPAPPMTTPGATAASQAVEQEDANAAPILCSFGSPVPENLPPPVWNLPQAVRNQCWNQMLAVAPRLTRGGQFGRNWCWVGMKEFGCHRHLWAHKTWAEYHDMAVESGATVSDAFEPLKHPALCDSGGLVL